MKRLWFGVGLLGVMLLLGLVSARGIENWQVPVSEFLTQAADAALSGDLQGAQAAADRAKTHWESRWRATAAISDHAPMDEIDGLFAKLRAYGAAENKTAFAACCRQISSLVEALADAHGLNWWNLL